jgi:hypothetical protein
MSERNASAHPALAPTTFYYALSGAFFFLPFDLIQVQGYSATLAGSAFLPFTLIMGGLSRWSGGLIDHYGVAAFQAAARISRVALFSTPFRRPPVFA